MPRLLSLLLAGALIMPLPALALEPHTPPPLDPFGFTEEQYSSFGIVDAPYPYSGRCGCYPVGNGVIFGHLGVAADFTLLRGLTGPGYQTRDDAGKWEVWQEGNWPDIPLHFKATAPKGPHWPVYHLGDKWTTQSIQVLRGAAMVRTVQTAAFGSLYCLTYCDQLEPVILREYAFVPDLSAADADWSYFLELDTSSAQISRIVQEDEHGSQEDTAAEFKQGPNWLTVWCPHCPVDTYEEQGERLRIMGWLPEPEQAEGVVWRCTVGIFASKNSGMWPANPVRPEEFGFIRSMVYGDWQAFSAQNLKPDMPDWLLEQGVDPARLSDLMTQIPVIIETQRDAYSGGVSPMVSYHGYWVRDTNGPLLVDLANGRFENALRMLRYHRAVSLKRKHCGMMIPLDEDLSELPGWQSAPVAVTSAGDLSGIGTRHEDWEGVGIEHAEVPSLIVLQHYWTWRAMQRAGGGWPAQADAFIDEAWPFIWHNFNHMSFWHSFGVGFHGDETYAGGALYSTYDHDTRADGAEPEAESAPLGAPNAYIPYREWFNFDNTYLHAAAAGALLELAEMRGIAPGPQGDWNEANSMLWKQENLSVALARDYWDGDHWAAALSWLSNQRWPDPFLNITLGCYWPGAETALRCPLVMPAVPGFTPERLLAHAQWYAARRSSAEYGTTMHSPYATAHAPAGELLALRGAGGGDLRALRTLLNWCGPDAAWCEVYRSTGPDSAVPVEIYGRVNRIRPWESGINYCALLAWLDTAPAVPAQDAQPASGAAGLALPSAYALPMDARLLVLTTDLKWNVLSKAYLDDLVQLNPDVKELLPPDLAGLESRHVAVWDAGLPFSADILRAVCLAPEAAAAIPYLYISPELLPPPGDDPGYDRRTFKSREFWLGEQMRAFARAYVDSGGTILPAEVAERLLGG